MLSFCSAICPFFFVFRPFSLEKKRNEMKEAEKNYDSRSVLDKKKGTLVPIRQNIIVNQVYLVYTSKTDELL